MTIYETGGETAARRLRGSGETAARPAARPLRDRLRDGGETDTDSLEVNHELKTCTPHEKGTEANAKWVTC